MVAEEKVPLLPKTLAAEPAATGTLTAAGSSSTMVQLADDPVMRAPGAAPTALLRMTLKLSFNSSLLSSRTVTVMVLLVSPGWKVRMPEALTKSEPAVAVPLDVAHWRLTVWATGLVSETVKVTGVEGP